MLKITAYASAQPVATGRNGNPLLDGWGQPRQTIYLKQTKFGKFAGTDYKEIADYQLDFMHRLEQILAYDPKFALQQGWDRLPKIYNDPRSYSAEDLIADTRRHYQRGHDPALSMILRQRYLIRKLAQDLNDNSVIPDWDIELTFRNPTEPVLKKFYDKGVFEKTASTTTSFDSLFGV